MKTSWGKSLKGRRCCDRYLLPSGQFWHRYSRSSHRWILCLPCVDNDKEQSKKEGWAKKEASTKYNWVWMIDVRKMTKLFDYLVKERFITYLVGHYTLLVPKIKGQKYYKYHDVWSHSTINYWAFHNMIQKRINKGLLKSPKKSKETMQVNEDPFSTCC